MKQGAFLLLSIGLLAFVLQSASALIVTGTGNQPIPDPGLPEGSLATANLESRVGWWEGPPFGGGEWHFAYCGDAAALSRTLTNFAGIRAPALEVVLHSGPHEDPFLKTNIDWSFTVWAPTNWNALYSSSNAVFKGNPNFGKPVPPPRLDIYLNGSLEWGQVKVPRHLPVRDERGSRPEQQPRRQRNSSHKSAGTIFALTQSPLDCLRTEIRSINFQTL